MPKIPISITLDQENVLWLRGRVRVSGRRSLSEALDALVTEARASGRVQNESVRSVVGTIDIAESDPLLLEADAYVRGLFGASARRPLLMRESRKHGGTSRSRSRARKRRT